jgi:hypothetical protein
VRQRRAPPHTIWVLICPDTGDYSYILWVARDLNPEQIG